MSGYAIGRKTIYKEIKKLTISEYLYFDKNSDIVVGSYESNITKHKLNSYLGGGSLSDLTLSLIKRMVESVNGKKIAVPLSAGYDSRLIVSALREIGHENVICYYYGRNNSFEQKASKSIARKLGYKWYDASLTYSVQKKYFRSDDYQNYKNKFDLFYGVPFVQDVSAIYFLKRRGIVDRDTVIVNGNSGDFISGGHIPPSFHNCINNKMSLSSSIFWENFLEKHYSLWDGLRSSKNDKKIILSLNEIAIEIFGKKGVVRARIENVYEMLEYYGRQSNYVVGGQRSYDHHGLDWRLPLWDSEYIDFWKNTDFSNKYNQHKYKEMLIQQNWGNVWKDIPINNKYIMPKWFRPARFITKSACLGNKKIWHRIDKNIYQYWMDDTYNSSLDPYYYYVFDTLGHRNRISWQSKKYLCEKGIDISALVSRD